MITILNEFSIVEVIIDIIETTHYHFSKDLYGTTIMILKRLIVKNLMNSDHYVRLGKRYFEMIHMKELQEGISPPQIFEPIINLLSFFIMCIGANKHQEFVYIIKNIFAFE